MQDQPVGFRTQTLDTKLCTRTCHWYIVGDILMNRLEVYVGLSTKIVWLVTQDDNSRNATNHFIYTFELIRVSARVQSNLCICKTFVDSDNNSDNKPRKLWTPTKTVSMHAMLMNYSSRLWMPSLPAASGNNKRMCINHCPKPNTWPHQPSVCPSFYALQQMNWYGQTYFQGRCVLDTYLVHAYSWGFLVIPQSHHARWLKCTSHMMDMHALSVWRWPIVAWNVIIRTH